MARLIFIVMLLIAAPAGAQTGGAPPPDDRALPELDALEDMARAMRDAMRAYGERLAPWAEQLGRLLDEPDAYDAPVVLPNGDILIRRKPGAPPLKRPDTENDTPGLTL